MANPLWKNATIYQIYPRSFCDSNGDGIGDIRGIISKLDYLKDLGVKILWLSPVYESPLDDLGYDVSDYYKIHPDYGTMEDFDELLKEADKRGLKIVMDLVVNHTSDEHPWFIASKDKNSPYHQYYYWRKGKEDNKLPPNNWTSMFTGPAWEYVEEVGEYYLHLYSKKQPDLDYHNPNVIEEVENILRFYLDKGVYGFRCDVINQIYKETLEDGKGKSEQARGIEHYLMKEGNHQILKKFYEDVFSKRECVVIGETYNVDEENGLRFLNEHEMDMFFQFEVMGVDQSKSRVFAKKFDAEAFKELIFKWQKLMPWNANYFENHDQRRSITRFGDEGIYHDVSGKALGLLNITLRGTPFVYQGQEIGMIDQVRGEPEDSKDVAVATINKILLGYHLPRFARRRICHRLNRDHARTPMQWDDGVSAGFSSNPNTWIPVNPRQLGKINVKAEEKDPASVLNFYKELIHLREKMPSLYDGEFIEVPTKGDLIAFIRKKGEESTLTLINLGRKNLPLPSNIIKEGSEVLLSTYMDKKMPKDTLRPYEGLLIELS